MRHNTDKKSRINGKTVLHHLVLIWLVSIKNQIVQQLLCNSNLKIFTVMTIFISKMVFKVQAEPDVTTGTTTINSL